MSGKRRGNNTCGAGGIEDRLTPIGYLSGDCHTSVGCHLEKLRRSLPFTSMGTGSKVPRGVMVFAQPTDIWVRESP